MDTRAACVLAPLTASSSATSSAAIYGNLDHRFSAASHFQSSTNSNNNNNNNSSNLKTNAQATAMPPATYQLTAAQNNKRKEKARIAARVRRSQEASIIMEMANELHITQEKMRRIDKTTIIKLAIDYIKAFELLCREPIVAAAPAPTPAIQHQLQPSTSPAIKCARVVGSADCENSSMRATTNSNTPTVIHQAPRPSMHSQKRPPLQLQVNQQQSATHQQRRAQQIQRLKQLETTNYENNAKQPCELDPDDHQGQENNFSFNPSNSNSNHRATGNRSPQVHQPIEPPSISTASIFEPKTIDNANSHYLMIEVDHVKSGGSASFVLKPDTEILDEDDLTHLAPQAGDMSIPLDVEPLESIVLDDKMTSLFVASPINLSQSSYLPQSTAATAATSPSNSISASLTTPPPPPSSASPLSPFSSPSYSSSSQMSPVYMNTNTNSNSNIFNLATRHQPFQEPPGAPFRLDNSRILINFHGRHDNYY